MNFKLILICLLISSKLLALDLESKYKNDLISFSSNILDLTDTLCFYHVVENSDYTLLVSNGKKFVDINTNKKFSLKELEKKFPDYVYKILKANDFYFYKNLINTIVNVKFFDISNDSNYYVNASKNAILEYDSVIDVRLSHYINIELKTISFKHERISHIPFYSSYLLLPNNEFNFKNKKNKLVLLNINEKNYGLRLHDSLKDVFNSIKYKIHYIKEKERLKDSLNGIVKDLNVALDSALINYDQNNLMIKDYASKYKIGIDFDILDSYSDNDLSIELRCVNYSQKTIKTIKVKFKGTNSINENVTYSKELSCVGFQEFLSKSSCKFDYIFGFHAPYYTSIHSVIILYKDGSVEKLNKNQYTSTKMFDLWNEYEEMLKSYIGNLYKFINDINSDIESTSKIIEEYKTMI